MDMDVDTTILREIEFSLYNCRNRFQEAEATITENVRRAGYSLEGRQYSLSVQETKASCEIIMTSADNLRRLEDHVNRLGQAVNEYLKCKYGG